jgi:hypothetical protein
MKMMRIKCAAWMVLMAFTVLSGLNAQMRPFTNDNGTVIQAELVSHKGDKVKLRRTDGKEFEVNPSIFSNEDEDFIKTWMARTPAAKNYNLKIAISKKKMEGNSMNLGYKRVKNDMWSFVLAVTNNSQDAVSNLTVKYRVFYSNAADGTYSSFDDRSPLRMVEGSEKLEAELPFNGTREVTTTPVQIDVVDYEGGGYRYKDQLKGCLVRIVDEAGNVILDWVSPEVGMKGKSWLNTNPQPREGNKSVIVH